MPRGLHAAGALAAAASWLAGAALAAVVKQGGLQVSAAASGSTRASGSPPGLTPTLKPESDHAFRSDYAHDVSPKPKVDLKFGYPYPLVQDNGAYDTDYVKDENDDSGEWKAQMDYDTLRIKIEKLKAQVNLAKTKEGEAKKQLDGVTAKEAAAEAESEKAEKVVADAEKENQKDKESLQDLQGKEGGTQIGGKIADQVAEVNKEISHVEECQRQLKEAQDQLKAFMELQERREKLLEDAKHQAGADKSEAEAKAQAAREAKYKKLDDDIVSKLLDEERNYQKSVQEFRMDEAEMQKTEAEFKKVAAQLRQQRQQADPEGGVYVKQEKSAAASLTPRLLLIFAAVASIAASCAAGAV